LLESNLPDNISDYCAKIRTIIGFSKFIGNIFLIYDLMTDYEAPEGGHAPVYIAGVG
jgi:hypothetical protein